MSEADNRNNVEWVEAQMKEERARLWKELKRHWRGSMGPAYIVVSEIEYMFDVEPN